MFRAGLYARVSTDDQQTLPMQCRAMREYAARRDWAIAVQVREIGSGAIKRQAREKLLRGCTTPRDRCSVGLATGSLGPLRNRSAGDTPGTGASGRWVRFADRGARPHHARRSGDGRITGDLRRVRKTDSAGTNQRGACSRAGERKKAGSAGNCSRTCCGSPETASRRRKQIRNRPPAADRPDIGTAHPGGSIFEQDMFSSRT